MAVYDVLPKTNLEFQDIRDTLNANNGSVSNVVSSAFQSGANINKWAKYKPVRLNQDFPAYDRYWKANDYYCGFDLKSAKYSNAGDIGKVFPTWNYLLPRGGSDEPFRLGDFRGYYPKANVQYVPLYPADSRKGQTVIIAFPEQNYNENSLKFTDILGGLTEDVWICAKIFTLPTIPSFYIIAAAQKPLSQGGNFTVTYKAESTGTHKAYPFLATKCENGTTTPQSEFYAFPDGEGINREGSYSVGDPSSGVLDLYQIIEWGAIETNYRYIKYECMIKRKSDVPADLRPSDFLISYRIHTEYDEYWVRSQEKPNGGELPVVTLQSDKTIAKVTGTVYFDNTIKQKWTGDLMLGYEIYDAGVKNYDALGGVHLEYNY